MSPGTPQDTSPIMAQNAYFVATPCLLAAAGDCLKVRRKPCTNPLSKLAQLPDTTQIYCAHEYTLDNIRFAKIVEPANGDLLAREAQARDTRAKNWPTVPSSLALEKRTNPFLRSHVPSVIQAAQHYAGHALPEPWQVFATVRAWKDALD